MRKLSRRRTLPTQFLTRDHRFSIRGVGLPRNAGEGSSRQGRQDVGGRGTEKGLLSMVVQTDHAFAVMRGLSRSFFFEFFFSLRTPSL